MIQIHAQVTHPNAPNVIVSFKIPDPQKTTEGTNKMAMANHLALPGYFLITAEKNAHNPLKLKTANNNGFPQKKYKI